MNPKIFANLRDALANLYPDESSIRRVIADAGIDSLNIVLNSTSMNNWHSILEKAENIVKLDALLTIAENEYKSNPKFQNAFDAYHRSLGQTDHTDLDAYTPVNDQQIPHSATGSRDSHRSSNINVSTESDSPFGSIDWKGLDSYRSEDMAFFFGRNRECNILPNKILNNPVTIIYGPSGVGKTSLIEAGIIPEIEKKQHVAVFVHCREDPLEETIMAIHDKFTDPNFSHSSKIIIAPEKQNLREYLLKILNSLKERRLNSQEDRKLCLFLDQFETYFTRASRVEQEKNAIVFLETLRWFFDTRKNLRLIFALREDKMDLLIQNEKHLDQPISGWELKPLSVENARRVIQETARVCQYSIERKLVSRILNDLADKNGYVDPSTLQIICERLSKDCEDRHLKYKSYEALGNKERIWSDFLELSVNNIGVSLGSVERIKAATLRILNLLVDYEGNSKAQLEKIIMEELNGGDLEELNGDGISDIETKNILNELARYRLIRSFSRHQPKYEVIHEKLAKVIHQRNTPKDIEAKYLRNILDQGLKDNVLNPIILSEFDQLDRQKDEYRFILYPRYCKLMFYSALMLGKATAFWGPHAFTILPQDVIKKVLLDVGDKSISFIENIISIVQSNLCQSLIAILLTIRERSAEDYLKKHGKRHWEAPFTLNYESLTDVNNLSIDLYDRKQVDDIQIIDEPLAWIYEFVNHLMRRPDYESQVSFVAEQMLEAHGLSISQCILIARLLGAFGSPLSVHHLISRLKTEDNIWVKQAIIEALVEIGEPAGEYLVEYILKLGHAQIKNLLSSLCAIAGSPRSTTAFRLVCYCLARELLFFYNSEVLPQNLLSVARILSIYGLSPADKVFFDTIHMDKISKENFIWILEIEPSSLDQSHILGENDSPNTSDLMITKLTQHFCLTRLSILGKLGDYLAKLRDFSGESMYVFFQGIAQLYRSRLGLVNQETISNLLETILANESPKSTTNTELIDQHEYDRFTELVCRLYQLNSSSLVNQGSDLRAERLQLAIQLWEYARAQKRQIEPQIRFTKYHSSKDSLPKITFKRLD